MVGKWSICKTPPRNASQPRNGVVARQTKGGAVISDVPGGPGADPRTSRACRPKALGFCFGPHDFRKIRSILCQAGSASNASATPGPKPPNKGWGRTFMDVPSTPTKSGDERLTHPEALGFYFGPPVLTQSDTRSAHRSNWPPWHVQRLMSMRVRCAVPRL